MKWLKRIIRPTIEKLYQWSEPESVYDPELAKKLNPIIALEAAKMLADSLVFIKKPNDKITEAKHGISDA